MGILDITTLILLLIASILICFAVDKTTEVEKAYKDTKRKAEDLEQTNKKLQQDNRELRGLRLQEVHDNTILKSQNRKLEQQLQQVKEIVESNNYGRTDIQVAKIKEVISSNQTEK